MKTLDEQQLWDYIEGNLSEKDQKIIQYKIDTDSALKKQYEDFLSFHLSITNSLDLDEPSMAFTRNVIDKLEGVPAPISLKTKVDNRIIMGIATFFVLALMAILGLAIYNSKPLTEEISFKFNTDLFEQKTLWLVFLFMDLIIALVFIDSIIRKRLYKKQNNLA